MSSRAVASSSMTRTDSAVGERWPSEPVELLACTSALPGKGSVFTVRLPGSADSQAMGSTDLDGRRSPAAESVLVIDDDATARELIADHLKAEGFSVVTAAGGVEGLKLARELRPTAITLDVMMPDLDGWSVLAALRKELSWPRFRSS